MDPMLFLTTTDVGLSSAMMEVALAQEQLRKEDAKYLVVQIAKSISRGA